MCKTLVWVEDEPQPVGSTTGRLSRGLPRRLLLPASPWSRRRPGNRTREACHAFLFLGPVWTIDDKLNRLVRMISLIWLSIYIIGRVKKVENSPHY